VTIGSDAVALSRSASIASAPPTMTGGSAAVNGFGDGRAGVADSGRCSIGMPSSDSERHEAGRQLARCPSPLEPGRLGEPSENHAARCACQRRPATGSVNTSIALDALDCARMPASPIAAERSNAPLRSQSPPGPAGFSVSTGADERSTEIDGGIGGAASRFPDRYKAHAGTQFLGAGTDQQGSTIWRTTVIQKQPDDGCCLAECQRIWMAALYGPLARRIAERHCGFRTLSRACALRMLRLRMECSSAACAGTALA